MGVALPGWHALFALWTGVSKVKGSWLSVQSWMKSEGRPCAERGPHIALYASDAAWVTGPIKRCKGVLTRPNGRKDWGSYAAPGELDLMKTKATTRMREIKFIEGAGHWIQQEQPLRLSELMLAFIKEVTEA